MGAQTFAMRWPKTGLLVGLALLAGGGAVVRGQEGVLQRDSSAPLRFARNDNAKAAPSAGLDLVRGKPSANASGAQEARFPTGSESPRVRATIAGLDLVQDKPFADLQSAQGKEEATKSPTAECVEPPPMVRWQDYDGPLKKTVGAFAGRLERKSAHPPHYKPGAVLCSFAPKDKFILFVQDTIDPVTFLSAGFDAGTRRAMGNDLERTSPARLHPHSSRTSRFRRCLPRTRATTAWSMPAAGGDCSTRCGTCLWHTATTARRCLIFRNGWARPARWR